MKITFDENNTFLGIPKTFFDESKNYKPRNNEDSIGIKSVLDSVKEYPWENPDLAEHPFYKYPEYQYAVLTYIALFAEKSAFKAGTSADEIFNTIITQLLSTINSPSIPAYDENGNIYYGIGRIKALCNNVLVHKIIPFIKNLQLVKKSSAVEKSYYIDPHMTSIDTPLNNDDSEDKQVTLADRLSDEEKGYEKIETTAVLKTVRDSFPEDSDEWKIANWLIDNIELTSKDPRELKANWKKIADELGYSNLESKFRTIRKRVFNRIKQYYDDEQ